MSSSFAFGAALGAVCVCVSVTGCSGGDADNAVGGTGAGAAAGVGGAGAVGGQAGSGGSAGTGTGVGGATGGVGGASAGTGAFGGTGTAGTGGAAAGTGGSSGVGGGAGASAGSGSGSSGAGGVGMAGAGGSSGTSAEGGAGGGAAGSTGKAGSGGATSEHFSFFVTSLEAIRRESGSMDGFGGDLGGLSGADEICTAIAEASLPGAGAKGWHAFLSTSTVNAISRIGTGPWYDRLGHLVAMNVDGLLAERPAGDTLIVNDLPNELGQPNRSGTGTGMDDNHDTITGTNTDGEWDGGPTCDDWTSATGGDGPRVGHSWPANSGRNWMQAHPAPGCAPSVSLQQNGAGSGDGIGNGGGYGGFYCFAMMP